MGLYSVFHALVNLAWAATYEWMRTWQGWLRKHLEDHHHRVEEAEECVVTTKNGCIRGKVITLYQGHSKEWRSVNTFLGVPFAIVGDYNDRFKKPEPVEPWEGVRDCTEYGPRSVQQEMVWDRFLLPVRQDERHCLNMNIFAPRCPCPQEFPSGRAVLVFVHGGGYLIHGASNYGDWNICRNLCLHDVVVCVIQYRLGLLGFLSTGDDNCPGNFGLWDQLEAFKWIKENIASFGGDPTNVTAVGQSAGGACVDLLSLSPHCKGLISRIILMGGNANGNWALSTPERTISEGIALARKAGWTGAEEDYCGLIEFLKRQPPANLQASLVGKSPFNLMKSGLKLCPVIDGELLPKPVPLLRKEAPPITVIIGAAEYEALLFHALGRSQSNLTSIRKLLEFCIPDGLPNRDRLQTAAEDLYIGGVNLDDKESVSRAFLALYSDILMNNSIVRYCHEMVAAGHRVYLYNFTYYHQDQFGFFGHRMPFLAATHCHDLRYLLGKGLYSKFRPNHDDFVMLDMVTTLWTNFAKYGDPNSTSEFPIRWEPLKADNIYKHLKLDLEPEIASDFQCRRYEFWRKIDEMRACLGAN